MKNLYNMSFKELKIELINCNNDIKKQIIRKIMFKKYNLNQKLKYNRKNKIIKKKQTLLNQENNIKIMNKLSHKIIEENIQQEILDDKANYQNKENILRKDKINNFLTDRLNNDINLFKKNVNTNRDFIFRN